MSSGERPIGTAKGNHPNTEALCKPPPAPPPCSTDPPSPPSPPPLLTASYACLVSSVHCVRGALPPVQKAQKGHMPRPPPQAAKKDFFAATGGSSGSGSGRMMDDYSGLWSAGLRARGPAPDVPPASGRETRSQ